MTIQLISAQNPQWANAEGSAVILECVFSHIPNELMPFCAKADDVEAHGRDIFARAVAGEFGPIAEYVAPTPAIPQVVSMRQARLALLEAGLLTQVSAAIQSAGEVAVIEWEYARELRRAHPLTQQLSDALGITEQQLDDLFTLASTL